MTIGIGAFLGAVAVCCLVLCGAMLLRLRPNRICLMCGEKTPVEDRRCKVCGYEFAPIRGIDM